MIMVNQNDITIVVVTYKRYELLKELLESFGELNIKPGNFVIVDNENNPQTKELINEVLPNTDQYAVHYLPQEENLGGAGGFSRGVEFAYSLGSEWIWLMDDDVKILPEAVEKVLPWCEVGVKNNNRVLQVCRYNFDGTDFYWQYHFMTGLGIPNPIAPAGFRGAERSKEMNTACFEGGLFHRTIVQENGYPDPRFFIYWDDTVYGYLASKITQPLLINETVIQRTRTLEHIKLGTKRKLNSTSDMTRYYIMRNRGFIAQYFKIKGDYNPLLFTIGTGLSFIKEVIRLFITKSFKTGFSRLTQGMKDGRVIRKDKNFKAMPPVI
ncbi:glycosyl transferase [Actinomycetota bacterium]|nr:glycosyl transferase [Actinomycetota bacterium]